MSGPVFVVLLAGPFESRQAACDALVESGHRVSKRQDSGNLPHDDLAWIRTYGADPFEINDVVQRFGFSLRSYSVPIRPVAKADTDPAEEELGRRIDAMFADDGHESG